MPNGLTDSERILVDTNILVYAFDPSDPAKHRIAAGWIIRLLREDRLTLSVQTLNEFYMVATHPRKPLSIPPRSQRHAAAGCSAAGLALTTNSPFSLSITTWAPSAISPAMIARASLVSN